MKKTINSHGYWAAIDKTVFLISCLDIRPQHAQKLVCINVVLEVLALFQKPCEKLKQIVSTHSYSSGPITHRHAELVISMNHKTG
jgi:hypothetical protein